MNHAIRKSLLTAGATVLIAAILALPLSACSNGDSGNLPTSHLEEDGTVNFSHSRCGACHLNGERNEALIDR